jgi:putative ABC transport system permease protein
MFRNYLLAALRSFNKNKDVSIINILGLSIGFSIFILISLFITDEKKYDQFQSKKDQIYRVALDMGSDFDNPLTPKPFAGAAQQQIPEIISTVRIEKDRNPRALFVYENKRFNETNYLYADSSIFRIFDFHFLSGSPLLSLREPYSMVINRSTALKYFNSVDYALNKTIHKEGTNNYYKITGVVEDYPEQSHFHFDFIISFGSLNKEHDQNWMIPYMFTYLLLRKDASISEVEKKLTKIQVENFASQLQKQSGITYADFLKKNKHDIRIYLEPLNSIHLNSHHRVELENNGNGQTVRLFGLVALLILSLSAINFINLATASASTRAKEIGVRKIVGAKKIDLVKQFFLESYLLCLFCILISIVNCFIFLPFLNEVSEKHLSVVTLTNYSWIIFLILLWAAISTIAGFYPALYLATIKTTESIKGITKVWYPVYPSKNSGC